MSLAHLSSCSFLFAQAVDTPESSSPIRVDVDVVNVLCTVSDKRGALVTDLRKEDFEIRENGRKQEIRYFARNTDLPLTIAMLMDVSGSVREALEAEREAAGRFFAAVLRPTDHALLLGFSSTLVLWQDFTSSTARLANSLRQLHAVPFRGLPANGQPMPGTLLYDAVYQTALGKLQGVSGRKMMLIVSDGLDNGSRMHMDEALQAVQETNTVVYGICYDQKFFGCDFLKELAEPTGGRVFDAAKKRKSLGEIYRTIEDELRSEYALGYVPMDTRRDGKFRKLSVKVDAPGLRVSVRRGYYAPDGAGK
ncbi:MAG: VWA domain-containing protein [Bryobacterales bacterium]|nr:VWA domain-containing protein [Bryobacterales bacterium]